LPTALLGFAVLALTSASGLCNNGKPPPSQSPHRFRATCTISATGLSFGAYTGTALPGTSTITVTCTGGTTYNVGLNPGTATGATVTTRKMTGHVSWRDAGIFAVLRQREEHQLGKHGRHRHRGRDRYRDRNWRESADAHRLRQHSRGDSSRGGRIRRHDYRNRHLLTVRAVPQLTRPFRYRREGGFYFRPTDEDVSVGIPARKEATFAALTLRGALIVEPL
jgi:hypothetical protein